MLILFSKANDNYFGIQLVRSECLNVVAGMCSNASTAIGDLPSAVELMFHLSNDTHCRIELAKLGILQFLKDKLTSTSDLAVKKEYLFTLVKYCGDAYCRVKFREENLFQLIIDEFAAAEPCGEVVYHLSKAFLCFLYDEAGLHALLYQEKFLMSLFRQLQFFQQHRACGHFPYEKPCEVGEHSQKVVESDETILETDFRPNSPSYVEISKKLAEISSTSNTESDRDIPFCKSFLGDSMDSPQRSPDQIGSPGPSWSPSQSSFESYISLSNCSSPDSTELLSPRPDLSPDSMTYPFCEGCSSSACTGCICCSDSEVGEVKLKLRERTDSYRLSNDEEPNGVSPSGKRTFDDGSQFQQLQKKFKLAESKSDLLICNCPKTEESRSNNSGGQSDLLVAANILEAVLKFISWLSHNDSFAYKLVKVDVLKCLIQYVSSCCSPNSRSIRILKRIIRNPQFLEELLKMDFHSIILANLCRYKAGALRPAGSKCPNNCDLDIEKCWRCAKNCRIGCDIFSEFQLQVDSEYGFGILSHWLKSKNSDEKLFAAYAAGLLIKLVVSYCNCIYQFHRLP